MLEIVNQLDGFDARGNVKVLMATNRPDTLDPALLRPGRMDRRVEFGVPDLEGRTEIFKIHSGNMNCERDIRFELLARLCPNCTGADLRSVCTEAGMYAIRARRKQITEKDMLEAINKVIKGYAKFSATPKVCLLPPLSPEPAPTSRCLPSVVLHCHSLRLVAAIQQQRRIACGEPLVSGHNSEI